MKYFISGTDKNGYDYTIDNLILEYTLKHPNEDVIQYLHDLVEKYPDIKENEYYESLNKPYSSRWQYFNNFIHLCDGCSIWYGKWTLNNEGDKTCFPLIKIEFNPNKHMEKPIVMELFAWIYQIYGDAILRKYDFAIDIKCKKEDVQIIGSRKEKGLYKGTRYYGQRNKDGYCKIYDKKEESDLGYDLTRVEHTFVHNKRGDHKKQGVSFENIYVKQKSEEKSKLKSPAMQAIYELCILCEANKVDYSDALNILERHKKKEILDAISGGTYKKLEIDLDLHDKLIDQVYDVFHINKIHKPLVEDVNGFVVCPDDVDLPFE